MVLDCIGSSGKKTNRGPAFYYFFIFFLFFCFFVLFLFFCFVFVFSSKFQNCTPWRNDQNLIVPVLIERKERKQCFFCFRGMVAGPFKRGKLAGVGAKRGKLLT